MRLKGFNFAVRLMIAAGMCGGIAAGAYYAFAELTPSNPRVSNLWPISVIERLSGFRTYRHSSGPVMTRNQRPESDRTTFRPILTAVKEYPDDQLTVDFLPPIGQATKSGTDKSFHIFPLLSHRSWKADDGSSHQFTSVLPIYHHKVDGSAHHTAVFPIYMSGTSGSVSYPIPFKSTRDYTAVFPIYGNLYGAFGNDRISFAFWPLYTRIEKTQPGSNPAPFVKHQVLWPFFTFGTGGGYKSFKFWPIYGQTIKEGQYASRFFLWPIFNVTRNLNPDTSQGKDILAGLPVYWDIQEGKSHSRSLFPFYGKRITPDLERSFKAWPLFINTKYIKEGYQTKDYLWPIFSKTEGSLTGVKFWPVFGTRKKTQVSGSGQRVEDVSTFYLWTLGKYERSTRRDSRRVYHRLFPLYVFGRYDDSAGYKQRQVFVWPLVSYQEDSLQGAKTFSFPNLLGSFESQFPMIQEVYSPLWRVVDYARQGEESRLSFLWNFIAVRKDDQKLALSLGPIFTLHRNEQGVQEYTLLSTLRIRNRGTVRPDAPGHAATSEKPAPMSVPAAYSFNRRLSGAWDTGVQWIRSVGTRVSNVLTIKQ